MESSSKLNGIKEQREEEEEITQQNKANAKMLCKKLRIKNTIE